MSFIDLLLVLMSFFSYASTSPVLRRDFPIYNFTGDAPFTVDSSALASSLTCPNGNPSQTRPPVLLVHGTATTGQESWGDGYVPALLADGYTACYITIPNRSMGDMQVNAEYIAYNLHYLSSLSAGQQVAVVSHSQGGPNTQWALQFWPSMQNVTRAFVALSPDFQGIDLLGSTSLLNNICADGLCQAAMWQQSAGSKYYNALHDQNFHAQVPTTAIWTQFDGVVVPAQQNAQLPGANPISVQDLCPFRPDSHLTMTVSSAAYALGLDALNNDGVASLSRVRGDALQDCLRVTASNMDISIVKNLQSLFQNLMSGFLNVSAAMTSEPPIMPYAQ